MQERRQYITDDGEIISESFNTFADAFNEQGYRFPSHKLGSRMFADVEFPMNMTDSEIGKMTRLGKRYMIAATNMLGYRERRQILPYTTLEIIDLVGMSGKRGRQFMHKMIRLHVLQRIETNSGYQYYVNPAYFMPNGKRLSIDLFLLFRDELTPLLPEWVMHEFLRQANEKAIMASDVQQEAERIISGNTDCSD